MQKVMMLLLTTLVLVTPFNLAQGCGKLYKWYEDGFASLVMDADVNASWYRQGASWDEDHLHFLPSLADRDLISQGHSYLSIEPEASTRPLQLEQKPVFISVPQDQTFYMIFQDGRLVEIHWPNHTTSIPPQNIKEVPAPHDCGMEMVKLLAFNLLIFIPAFSLAFITARSRRW